MYDIIIIGAGVNGCSIARELSKYKLNIAVIERASDVCEGTSKANSGISHAGYDAKSGTLKAKLNVRGTQLMGALSKELGFLYRNCGSLVLCFDENDMPKLKELFDRGKANGVPDIEIISGDEARTMEPELSKEVVAALYAPTAGIVDPFGLTISMAENAAYNGVEFIFDSKVTDINSSEDGTYIIQCKTLNSRKKIETTEYSAKIVINAAGVYADEIHNMISSRKINIRPRRGEYMLLDTTAGNFVKKTIFQLPTSKGKGILITPTVHGNMLVGPTATDIEDKEDTETTAEDLLQVKTKSLLSAPGVPLKEVITSFAGLRARLTEQDDFLIEECEDAKGFIDVAGMESPGLSCAPATAEYVADLVKNTGIVAMEPKEDFKIYERKYAKSFLMSDNEARGKMIEENPLYGNVVCRCCTVTEGEIVEAIHSIIPARTADGVKRRTGASMGRCQAGFCNPKIVDIIARELNIPPEMVTKNDSGSEFLK